MAPRRFQDLLRQPERNGLTISLSQLRITWTSFRQGNLLQCDEFGAFESVQRTSIPFATASRKSAEPRYVAGADNSFAAMSNRSIKDAFSIAHLPFLDDIAESQIAHVAVGRFRYESHVAIEQ